MAMLTSTARCERSTLDSMATPCTVKAQGSVRAPHLMFDITICDVKAVFDGELGRICDRIAVCSSAVSCQLKHEILWKTDTVGGHRQIVNTAMTKPSCGSVRVLYAQRYPAAPNIDLLR